MSWYTSLPERLLEEEIIRAQEEQITAERTKWHEEGEEDTVTRTAGEKAKRRDKQGLKASKKKR